VQKYGKQFCDPLPKFDRSVSLVCWAYNEQELIEGFLWSAVTLLRESVEDFEIVVVDDGSTDRTNEIIRALIPAIPQIRLIHNSVNMNVGPSFLKAVKSASKQYVFWQTVDWSYDISYLRIFLELLKSFDVVAGVRRAPVETANRGAKAFLILLKLFGVKHITKRSDTIPKAIISVINYALIRCLFNFRISDYQNVVFYPRELIQSFTLESRSSFGNPEFLMKAHWRGASIVEVPISFLPRQAVKAKGTRVKAITASVYDIFRLWVKWIILDRRGFVRKGNIRRLDRGEWNE